MEKKHMQISLLFILMLSLLACKPSESPISDEEHLWPPGSSTIEFSGYKWNVKNPVGTSGPMNNYWSNQNVWVDHEGKLHLKIRKDQSGRWTCAEISSTQVFGFGDYVWLVEGEIDKLDKNIVLGLFSYRGYEYTKNDEIDIEIARWGNDKWHNLNYTNYPDFASGISTTTNPKYITKTNELALESIWSTHRYRRTSQSIQYASFNGHTEDNAKRIFEWSTEGQTQVPGFVVTQSPSRVHMNLWLFEALPPSDLKEVEVIIKAFIYRPL